LCGCVVAARVFHHRWPYPLLLQGYATGVVLILMNCLRTLASHRWLSDGRKTTFIAQMLDSVTLDNDSLFAMLINPVGLRYHALHHLFPSMPYHNMRAAHKRLMQWLPPGSPYRQTVERSICEVIAELWRSAATRQSSGLAISPTNTSTLEAAKMMSTPFRLALVPIDRRICTSTPTEKEPMSTATAPRKLHVMEESASSESPLLADELRKIHAYWRAANYLSVGQIYLMDNPLLKEPLQLKHVKPRLLGHWGTTSGQNFLYVHLNRVIKLYDLNMLYISGPGHGGPALVANAYLEGTYTEVYPNISQTRPG
jgi:hypothetical protein